MESRQEILDAVFDLSSVELIEKRKFIPGKTRIPATFPDLHPEDVVSLVDCSLGYWYTEYKWAEKFRRLLCDVSARSFASLVNSGSSANLVAMVASLRKYSSERNLVLTCATGFPTTVSPIYQAGKIPYYVDIDPITLSPDMEQVWYAIEHNGDDICGAIFAHTLGFPYDESLLVSLVGQRRFFISDCCDALGASYDYGERHVGNQADYMTYSFFPAHNIFSAEGGAVLSDHPDFIREAEKISNWNRSCYCRPGEQNVCGHRFDWEDRGDLPEGWDHKYIFDGLGYNLKMTDLQAALGYSQLKRLDEMNGARKHNYDLIKVGLADLEGEGLVRFIHVPEWSNPVPFGFPITLPVDVSPMCVSFVQYLYEHKIETRRVFGGNLTKQPGFMRETYMRSPSLDGADFLMNQTVWFSVSPTLTGEMIDYMITIIHDYFDEVIGAS